MRELWVVFVALATGFLLGLPIGALTDKRAQHLGSIESVELSLQHVDDLLHDSKVCIARTDEILIQLYNLKLQRKP